VLRRLNLSSPPPRLTVAPVDSARIFPLRANLINLIKLAREDGINRGALQHFKHRHQKGQEFKRDGWFIASSRGFVEGATDSVALRDEESKDLAIFVTRLGSGAEEHAYYVFENPFERDRAKRLIRGPGT